MPIPSDSDPKLWLALLHEVKQAGGSAAPKDVMDKMMGHFPEITSVDLAVNSSQGEPLLRNRIRWARQRLVERGCLVKQKGVWQITPTGTQWLNSNWKGSGADYRKVVKPPRLKGAPPEPPHPPQRP